VGTFSEKHCALAVDWIRAQASDTELPRIGVVLGSGLGELVAEATPTVAIPYTEIPYFPRPTVAGHAGRLIIGRLAGVSIVAMQGRIHFYEGYDIDEVVFPIRVMGALGVSHLIITNAAGGINTSFAPGDLMVLTSHINLMNVDPLSGSPGVPRRLSNPYCPELRQIAFQASVGLGLPLREGIYAAVTGPSYETPAEIRFLRRLGADAVGMSTVPEALVAAALGIPVLGISCITNMAAGISNTRLCHSEVMEVTERVGERFSKILCAVLERI
jgi:purine-nucleoside phosphorylase